ADPGPVAGIPWVKRIADYSAETMSPKKVSLGVPFYAMRWEATDPSATPPPPRKWRGRSARYPEAKAPMSSTPLIWNETQNSPHLSSDATGHKTELWFENARSLQAKMELARDSGFRGISAWVIGQEDPAFWDSLDAWKIAHPRKPLASGSLDQRSKKA